MLQKCCWPDYDIEILSCSVDYGLFFLHINFLPSATYFYSDLFCILLGSDVLFNFISFHFDATVLDLLVPGFL